MSISNPDSVLNLKEIHQEMSDFVQEEYQKRSPETREEMENFLEEMNEVLEDRFPGAPFRIGMRKIEDKTQISLYDVSGRN